jgi:hypothetical protein
VSHNLNEGSKPFTMSHFIGWIGKHDRAQTYNYQYFRECLVAQYYKEHDSQYFSPADARWFRKLGPFFPGANAPFIRQAEWIARGPMSPAHSEVGEWTFGQALDRALEHTQVKAIA